MAQHNVHEFPLNEQPAACKLNRYNYFDPIGLVYEKKIGCFSSKNV